VPPATIAFAGLPDTVTSVLEPLIQAASSAFGDDLRSVVLYGSGAEQQLRLTSDVNLVMVARDFARAAVDAIREPLRVARAAGNVRVMLLPERDIASAAAAFSMKFADIRRRRKVLYGDDVFASLIIPPEALRRQIDEALLNFELRSRAAYAYDSLREEQLARLVAQAAGTLRPAAAALLELRGEPVGSPKTALERVAATLPNGPWDGPLTVMSRARRDRTLAPGEGGPALERLIALARELRAANRAV
jgi:hypothetical protein